MSQVVSGWERIARQFLERCRGFSIDEVVDEKRRILEEALPYWLARYLWLLFAYIIFHLKLLHAVTQPIHSFLTEGIKSTVYADGHFRRPRFSFSKIRVEIAVMLLTFSALWHCFSMPNPLGILRWGVTVRPQVNVKPRMSLLKKSYSSPHIAAFHNASIKRSVSESTLNIDVGVDARISNSLIDPILTTIDSLSESVSLASEFASSAFSESYMQTSNGSVISQSHMSLASSSTVESTCADELEEREEDEEKLATAIEEGESTTNESTDTHFAHDYTDNNNSNESEEEHDEYVEREIIPPLRWFSWKLPTLWRSSHTETLNDSNNA